jgi:hypothetical protein
VVPRQDPVAPATVPAARIFGVRQPASLPDVDELAASARRAGRRAVMSGRWLAETVVDVAPRLPVRDADRLSTHYDGLTGDELARELV